MELNTELVNLLIERKYKIAFAESCTGGMCASFLVDVANASWVLDMSIVTYANEAKIKYLGVKKETIDTFNVVSENVAYEMALGIQRASGATIGVGVTGAAGPSSDGIIPVGDVCIGYAIKNRVFTERLRLGEIGRNNVRRAVVEHVYRRLIEEVKNEG